MDVDEFEHKVEQEHRRMMRWSDWLYVPTILYVSLLQACVIQKDNACGL